MKAAILLLALLSVSAKGGAAGGTKAVPPPPPNPVDVILNLYDTNHNGRLEKDELKRMHDLEPDKCAAALKWDLDKSLSLDSSEVTAWKDFEHKKAAAKPSAG